MGSRAAARPARCRTTDTRRGASVAARGARPPYDGGRGGVSGRAESGRDGRSAGRLAHRGTGRDHAATPTPVAMPGRHLVSVWNPAYAADAMEAHLQLLLARAREAREQRRPVDHEDVCVCWAKVTSPNRLQPYPHDDDLAALAAELEDESAEPREVHLYLTDYRSLYVGHVVGVERTLSDEARAVLAPAYYATQGLKADWWFLLADLRRLVQDDLEGVIAQLAQLENVHYHHKKVSLYGGMVELPLIVERPDGATWFDPVERDAITGGRLWAEFDAEHGGTGAMARELRENLLGDFTWQALDPAVRGFLASGEEVFRRHRGDAAFDFAPAIACYGKALEVQVNALLRRVVPRLSAEERRVKVEDRTIELSPATRITLGQLAHALAGEPALRAGLARTVVESRWLLESLPAVLGDFTRGVRNAGTHETHVDRATATRWRDQVMGIGCEGHIVSLARCRPRV